MLIGKSPIALFRRHLDAVSYGGSSNHSIAAQGAICGKPCEGVSRIPRRGFTPRGWGAGLALLIALLPGCAPPPDEATLRATIAGMEAALEARDASGVLDEVDGTFIGPGGMDREALRRYLAVTVLRRDAIEIVLGPIDVTLHGDRASASFDAVAKGGPWLAGDVQARRVETVWRLEGGSWRLVSADWSKPALSD